MQLMNNDQKKNYSNQKPKKNNFCFFILAKCFNYVTGQSGTISTKNYPSNYEDNSNCQWLIQVEDGYKIEFNFTDFSIEEWFDYVDVFDGPTTASKLIKKFTGVDKSYAVITSTSNVLLVNFISDDERNFKGFFAHFKAGKTFR